MFARESETIYTQDVRNVEIHQIADMHRIMDEKEFESLKADIELNGQLTPAIYYRDRLVDGRHRLRALRELGIDNIKFTKLSHRLTLKDVENVVLGTEMRRSDNVAQKSIRAYRWLKENNTTQQEAAIKFGISQARVSEAKKVEDRCGSIFLDEMYQKGSMMIAGKKHTRLKTIIDHFKVSKTTDGVEKYSDTEKAIIDLVTKLEVDGNFLSLSIVEAHIFKVKQGMKEQ